jgi:hypothetical protein
MNGVTCGALPPEIPCPAAENGTTVTLQGILTGAD